jgi:hypothetical protein
VLARRTPTFGEFYKGYRILSLAVYYQEVRWWTSKVTIYPPVGISLNPTLMTSVEGCFKTDAEKAAVRMGRVWVDSQTQRD